MTRKLVFLALGLIVAGSLSAETITLLDDGTSLVFIDSAAPSVSLGSVAITGLQVGEVISGIDFRPANGLLYGLGASAAGTVAQLYQISTTTGAATPIGASFALNASTVVGMDFNPVADRLRVISNVGTNLRIDPATGAVTPDTNADYAPGDPNEGTGNVSSALAYSNNFVGAVTTTLYGINYANAVILVTVGSPNGAPVSPNTGQMFTVGSTGLLNFSNLRTGLDISAGGTAYAAINSPIQLYTVNLATAAVTPVGSFPVGTIRDLAVGGPVISNAEPAIPTLSMGMLAMLAIALGGAAVFVMTRR